ncbi:MAG: class I SAM-dependent methyltransferase, partial [Verrucomicrobiales bacterium]
DFLCIDQSEGMIAFSKKRLFPEARVQFIHADVRDGLTALDQSTFDVIVSHFFLDCFKDETLHDLIPEIAARLKPQGHWYVSEFTADTWWQRVLLWGMYRFFHLVTKTEASTFPAYTEIMQAHGFTVKRLGTWKADFVVADHFQRSSP